MAYLIVTTNGKELYRRQLAGPVTFGRSTDCDLWLNDTGVSRHHCRIEPAGKGWELLDLSSRNGVFVRGERITRHPLRDGDVLKIGAAKVTFHEVGFVASRPAAPTRSNDPMAETVVAPHAIASRPPPTPRFATPAVTAPTESAPSPVASFAFSRPSARPIPVQADASDDHADGERSQGLVRRWLQKK